MEQRRRWNGWKKSEKDASNIYDEEETEVTAKKDAMKSRERITKEEGRRRMGKRGDGGRCSGRRRRVCGCAPSCHLLSLNTTGTYTDTAAAATTTGKGQS